MFSSRHTLAFPSLCRNLLLTVLLISTGCAQRSISVQQPTVPEVTHPPFPIEPAESGRALTLTVVPGHPRALDSVRVYVLDPGQVHDGSVTVNAAMPSMKMGSQTVQATSDGSGKYHATVQFTMPGRWQLLATLRRGAPGEGELRKTVIALNVR